MKHILAAVLAVVSGIAPAWAASPPTVTPGALSWGTSPTFAPFEFQRDGHAVGFDVDMMAALARRIGLQSAMLGMDFVGIIPAVQARRIDAAVSGMYITPAREAVLDFIPYLRIGDQMVVPGRQPRPPRRQGRAVRAPHRRGGEHAVREVGARPERRLHGGRQARDRHPGRGQQRGGGAHPGAGPGRGRDQLDLGDRRHDDQRARDVRAAGRAVQHRLPPGHRRRQGRPGAARRADGGAQGDAGGWQLRRDAQGVGAAGV